MTENKPVTPETEQPQETIKEDEHTHKKHRHTKEEFEKLEAQIAQLEGENQRLQNEYYKAYADTQNLRKRLEADFELRQKYRIQSFALDILTAIDNLERAIVSANAVDTSLAKGFEMVYDQLISALKKEGVEIVNPENEAFDANFHQGLMSEVVEGVEPGQVLQVLQKGYKLKDRILRAALVKVSE